MVSRSDVEKTRHFYFSLERYLAKKMGASKVSGFVSDLLSKSRSIHAALFLLVPCIRAQNPYGRDAEGISLFGGGGYGTGGYPMFPTIPWLTVSQRYAGRPLYLPSPPIYVSGISNDQVGAYTNYRWDFFYQHDTTTAAPANGATAAASTDSVEVSAQNSGQASKSCRATNVKNDNGDNTGICLSETIVARNCPSGLADDGVGCGQSQKCCVNNAVPKEVQKILDRIAARYWTE